MIQVFLSDNNLMLNYVLVISIGSSDDHASAAETTPLVRPNTQTVAPAKSTASKIDTTKAYQAVIEDAQE